MTSYYLNYLLKDVISKNCHILRSLGSGLQPMNLARMPFSPEGGGPGTKFGRAAVSQPCAGGERDVAGREDRAGKGTGQARPERERASRQSEKTTRKLGAGGAVTSGSLSPFPCIPTSCQQQPQFLCL